MKKLLSLALSVIGLSSVHAQLNSLHNHYRAGDVLIKQQIEFIDPQQAGSHKLWDLTKIKTINEEYSLSYLLPAMEADSVYVFAGKRYKVEDTPDNGLIIGKEHNTLYYYRQVNDSLLQSGHENPVVKLDYTPEMTVMHFPLNYGQTITSAYSGQGLYSGTVDIHTQGTLTTSADAYGKMILPTGDTLNPVLRIRTLQTITDLSESRADSTQTNTKALETCRWYTKGYRYPILETVRNMDMADQSTIFSTAFYYPPQDHLYLDTDPDNLALLEELWDMEEKEEKAKDNETAKEIILSDIMECKIYPNPVETVLNISYEVKEEAKVSFDLYTIEGLLVKKVNPTNKPAGSYYQPIDCYGLHPKSYVLRVTANDIFINQVIIKK